ncbi:hypothetical protein B0I35DRAFT_436845 [Stachybotrys elegans]|uniref:Uncharacterized protein n=1 Tax=Stachybotrys elegans TaxID=80388 RepID=A0A8K0SHG3_9HYPO|nr:hypothetical protein B0I35DRAFT_436845 [Stachybotrys elegans]
MADSAAQSPESSTPKVSAAKDKNCPYCGQAFTSSSLGRHLDLYIKEKNPKPADGVHDVEAIKKMRGTITRRQPRGSLGGRRRDGSTPASMHRESVKKESSNTGSDGYRSPAIPKEGQFAVDSTLGIFSYGAGSTWDAGMNDLQRRNLRNGDVSQDSTKRPGMQRTVSKQVAQKAQFDVKQRLTDAMDTARAAELALRELLSSLRAARQHIDSNSMPFDFDPLSLDFPSLTLQCLQPPPTLFSSTQHPTSTSWSVQPPGQREFHALQTFFQEKLRAWKVTCTSAVTTAMEELTYSPSGGPVPDVQEAVRQAEQSAEHLEKQVEEHLLSAYAAWEDLSSERQHELWVLELARGFGRKNKELEKAKEQQHTLKQENSNLKSQIEQLNRFQQPREFKMVPPTTIPLERELVSLATELSAKSKRMGLGMNDRHSDIGTVVGRLVEKWKNVIVSTRETEGGMSAQKPLENPAPSPAPTVNGATPARPQNQAQMTASQAPSQPTQHVQQVQQQPTQQSLQKRMSSVSTNGAASEQTAMSSTTTAPPSIEETSDQDADAEMEDDDSFAIINASPTKPLAAPMQQQPSLEVPRTRGPVQQRANPDPRFMMQNGTGSPAGRAMAMSRSMPTMNMAMSNAAMHGADMTLAMQGVRSDAMYME